MEQSTLAFFSAFTAPKLSGYFSPDFWERRVPQASLAEPSIRHAVIALGAVHRDFTARHERTGRFVDASLEAFAIRHYTIAISHLHQLMSTRTQQLDITLISCILFIVFDCLIGHHTSALIHLKDGLKILEDIKWQNAQGGTTSQPTLTQQWEREFSPLLLGLGVQAASFVDPKYPKDREDLWESLRAVRIPAHPLTFNSLDEARHALETLAVDIMGGGIPTSPLPNSPLSPDYLPHEHIPQDHMSPNPTPQDQPPHDQLPHDHISPAHIPSPLSPSHPGAQIQSHLTALQDWTKALDRYLVNYAARDPSASRVRCGANLLKVHSLMLSIVASPPHHPSSTSKFDRILSLCEYLLAASTSCGRAAPSLSFSADFGIIAPLFFTAVRAPSLPLQQRAYNLLARAPGREGMWDSDDALLAAGDAILAAEQQQALMTQAAYRTPPMSAGETDVDDREWDEVQQTEPFETPDLSVLASPFEPATTQQQQQHRGSANVTLHENFNNADGMADFGRPFMMQEFMMEYPVA
jgi:hypothetical protein